MFGLEPELTRRQLVDALGDHREIGPRDGVIQADQDIPGLHFAAVAHIQFTDDAAGRVLNLLQIGVDDK